MSETPAHPFVAYGIQIAARAIGAALHLLEKQPWIRWLMPF